MIRRLLFWLSGFLRCRLIKLNDSPYLERYYIGSWLGYTVFLHRFVRSDWENCLHNHPWRVAWSFILCGQYTEELALDLCPEDSLTGCLTTTRKIRFFNRVPHNRFHRIVEVHPDTWTLLIQSKRMRINGVPKCFGFICRVELGSQLGTLFTSVPESRWRWNKAPLGKDSGRASMREV